MSVQLIPTFFLTKSLKSMLLFSFLLFDGRLAFVTALTNAKLTTKLVDSLHFSLFKTGIYVDFPCMLLWHNVFNANLC